MIEHDLDLLSLLYCKSFITLLKVLSLLFVLPKDFQTNASLLGLSASFHFADFLNHWPYPKPFKQMLRCRDCQCFALSALAIGTVVSRFALNDFLSIGLTQSLSNKCEAFVWLFCFSPTPESKLSSLSRNKKASHLRERLCSRYGNRTRLCPVKGGCPSR